MVQSLEIFFQKWKDESFSYVETVDNLKKVKLDHVIPSIVPPIKKLFSEAPEYIDFSDIPESAWVLYPRLCLKVPTGGGKTLLGIKTIELYQNQFLEKRTGMIVWVVHRESIYTQTLEKIRDKSHPYRQMLDQISGDRTLILEKTDAIRWQDTQENLVVLMIMIDSINQKEQWSLKVFKDGGNFMDFFPMEHEKDKIDALVEKFPMLDCFEQDLLWIKQIRTSLGNIIRVCNPLFIVDEFHKVYTDAQKRVLDSLNPRCMIGLSATPKAGMNILVTIKWMDLYRDEMIKLPINVRPESNDNWRELIHDVREKREELEKKALGLKEQKGDYIRPIALLQADRTGKDKRDGLHVHADDIKEYLVEIGIPSNQIAIKSSYIDELKDEVLMSQDSEIRYIITKQALMEGWDCPFAYVLWVIPTSSSTTALTQLIGRVLRQPYTKRTGISELDQCYAYFNHSDSEELLKGIKKSLESDGLEDIVDTVKWNSGPSGKWLMYRDFSIQSQFIEEYPESLALPIWHIEDSHGIRALSYRSDILPRIDWDNIDLSPLIENLIKTVGKQKIQGTDLQYVLWGEYAWEGTEYEKEHAEWWDEYITSQIISEYIGNPFVSYTLVQKIIWSLSPTIERNTIESDFGYIAHEISKFIRIECYKNEEIVFNQLVSEWTIFLAITKEWGYTIPEIYSAPAKYDEDSETIIPLKADPKCLHLAVDYVTMNNLEKEIIEELKTKDKVLWWMRNKVEESAYKIQAWRKNKIYPDFIIAKQDHTGKLELVYIIESKWDQLAENLDTKYKQLVFQRMTEEKMKDGVRKFTGYNFQMIPQSNTKSALRELFQ